MVRRVGAVGKTYIGPYTKMMEEVSDTARIGTPKKMGVEHTFDVRRVFNAARGGRGVITSRWKADRIGLGGVGELNICARAILLPGI
jgi:hypothetical protein